LGKHRVSKSIAAKEKPQPEGGVRLGLGIQRYRLLPRAGGISRQS
jgi:hypothetical protein